MNSMVLEGLGVSYDRNQQKEMRRKAVERKLRLRLRERMSREMGKIGIKFAGGYADGRYFDNRRAI